jgi:hypothetical protein
MLDPLKTTNTPLIDWINLIKIFMSVKLNIESWS